jgi:hypothetical protein
MLTTDPQEAVDAATNVQTDYQEEGGSNLDAHIDGFMSGVEAVLARPGVNKRAYLSEVISSLEQEESSGTAIASEFLKPLIAKLKAAEESSHSWRLGSPRTHVLVQAAFSARRRISAKGGTIALDLPTALGLLDVAAPRAVKPPDLRRGDSA